MLMKLVQEEGEDHGGGNGVAPYSHTHMKNNHSLPLPHTPPPTTTTTTSYYLASPILWWWDMKADPVHQVTSSTSNSTSSSSSGGGGSGGEGLGGLMRRARHDSTHDTKGSIPRSRHW